MPFWVEVNIDGVVRKMDTLAKNASDLEPALDRIGGYVRSEAIRRFKEQAFPPLSAATLKARAQKGLAQLERKLSYDAKKAKRRAHDARREAAPQGVIARALAALTLSDIVGNAAVSNTKGVQNRLATLEEFRRRHRGGQGGRLLSVAQTKSLNSRELRAVAKAVGKPILGQLQRSPVFKTSNGSVTIKEATYAGFSQVHNEGGTAGHGAREPERMTLEIDETDFAIFKAILVDELMVGVGSDD